MLSVARFLACSNVGVVAFAHPASMTSASRITSDVVLVAPLGFTPYLRLAPVNADSIDFRFSLPPYTGIMLALP